MEWSEGIRFVAVNGELALRDGKPTGVRAGRSLLRARAMPSRPMSISSSRALRAEAENVGRRIKVDLARGQLRVTGAGSTLEGTAFGLLQTAPRWSSVTGLVLDTATGAELGAVLIVDEVGGSITFHTDERPAMVWATK
jgi:N-acyl-D-amino-acid deacylase